MIAIACDHAGIDLKPHVIAVLDELGIPYKDLGTNSHESVDYPIYGARAANAVASGECSMGIIMCGTGVGIGMAASKVHGIRCALLSDPGSARLTREHNDAHMMALGAGFVGELLALEIVDTFLDTPFSNGERHKRRIEKLMAVEQG